MDAVGRRRATRLIAVPLNCRGVADSEDGGGAVVAHCAAAATGRKGRGRCGKVGGACGSVGEDGARGGEGGVVLRVRVRASPYPTRKKSFVYFVVNVSKEEEVYIGKWEGFSRHRKNNIHKLM